MVGRGGAWLCMFICLAEFEVWCLFAPRVTDVREMTAQSVGWPWLRYQLLASTATLPPPSSGSLSETQTALRAVRRLCPPLTGLAKYLRCEAVSGVGQHIDIDTLHALHDD